MSTIHNQIVSLLLQRANNSPRKKGIQLRGSWRFTLFYVIEFIDQFHGLTGAHVTVLYIWFSRGDRINLWRCRNGRGNARPDVRQAKATSHLFTLGRIFLRVLIQISNSLFHVSPTSFPQIPTSSHGGSTGFTFNYSPYTDVLCRVFLDRKLGVVRINQS